MQEDRVQLFFELSCINVDVCIHRAVVFLAIIDVIFKQGISNWVGQNLLEIVGRVFFSFAVLGFFTWSFWNTNVRLF